MKMTKLNNCIVAFRYLAEVQDDPFIVCSLENIGDEFTNWNAMFPAIKPTFCKFILVHSMS